MISNTGILITGGSMVVDGVAVGEGATVVTTVVNNESTTTTSETSK